MKRMLGVVGMIFIVFASKADAQDERGWVDINIGANRVASGNYQTTGDVPALVGTATLGAEYVLPQGWAWDVGGGYMRTPRFGFGGTVAGSRNREKPRLSVAVDNLSDATPAITPIDRFDLAVHLHALWNLRPTSDRVRLRVFGGPSVFRVIHETVDTVSYNPVIPTSAVRITSFTFSESDGLGWGGHVGGDVSYFLGPNVGLGAVVRYSRASVDLEDFSGTFRVKAGGLQYSGGLRVRF